MSNIVKNDKGCMGKDPFTRNSEGKPAKVLTFDKQKDNHELAEYIAALAHTETNTQITVSQALGWTGIIVLQSFVAGFYVKGNWLSADIMTLNVVSWWVISYLFGTTGLSWALMWFAFGTLGTYAATKWIGAV